MADVHVLPGVERRDLTGPNLPDEQILRIAIDKGVTGVVVVGRRRDGSLYVASATNDVDKATGMLMRAVSCLASGRFEQGIFEPDEEEIE